MDFERRLLDGFAPFPRTVWLPLVLEPGGPAWASKFGGWPAWVQGADRPPCPKCSRGVEALFQIDSNDLVDFMWGDVGVAHLFQCGEHPDELAFTWECH